MIDNVNDFSRRYVINFARAPIFGSGVGHHSPIGGYLEAEDLVLVLDVNEKFKPVARRALPTVRRDEYRRRRQEARAPPHRVASAR